MMANFDKANMSKFEKRKNKLRDLTIAIENTANYYAKLSQNLKALFTKLRDEKCAFVYKIYQTTYQINHHLTALS